ADCPALRDPSRTMLGGRQEQWLDREFKESRTPWNLIAQQTLVAPLAMPDRSGSTARIRTDGWDGYPLSRRRLLDSIGGRGLHNPVVVGGDLHAFFAADLRAEAPAGPGRAFPVVASEFVTTSVTSQAPGQAHYDRLKRANEHLRHADGTRRGYLRLTLAPRLMQADLMALDDVRRPESGISQQAAFVVEDGRPGPQPA
ncbi:MAG: alkaline phosphatase D family protein, partial [Lautropia sp.]